jgi:predicted ATP-dependent protease
MQMKPMEVVKMFFILQVKDVLDAVEVVLRNKGKSRKYERFIKTV